MATPFSQDRVLIGYFLAKTGKNEIIPGILKKDYGVSSLVEATLLFFPKLRGSSPNGTMEDGTAFSHSITNYRAQCDGYLEETPRKGHKPGVLFNEEELQKVKDLSDQELYRAVKSFIASPTDTSVVTSTYLKRISKQDVAKTFNPGNDAAERFFLHPTKRLSEPGDPQSLVHFPFYYNNEFLVAHIKRIRASRKEYYLTLPKNLQESITEGSILIFEQRRNGVVIATIISQNDYGHAQFEEVVPAGSKIVEGEPVFERDDLFLSSTQRGSILRSLKQKKNIILQGPPGTGKTFIASTLTKELGVSRKENNLQFVQFHQSYGYEDFVIGYHASKDGFELRNGVFLEFVETARKFEQENIPHVLIIDEINRGNLSRIFGELMMLIEPDKRTPSFALQLSHQSSNKKFYVPKNLFLIGTMNTADMSLGRVDYALRRRFVFHEITPHFGEKFHSFLKKNGCPLEIIKHVRKHITELNSRISDPNDLDLGKGCEIGHSYFCSKPQDGNWDHWLDDIIEFEIAPLLDEYLFDKADKSSNLLLGLRSFSS